MLEDSLIVGILYLFAVRFVPEGWVLELLLVVFGGFENHIPDTSHVAIGGTFQASDRSTCEAERFLHVLIEILLALPVAGGVDPVRLWNHFDGR